MNIKVTTVKVPRWQILSGTLVFCALSYVCAWILFQNGKLSLIAALLISPFLFVYVKNTLNKRFERKIEKQFADVLLIISASLSSGMRLEQCIGEIATGTDRNLSLMRAEFVRMNKLISLNRTAVKAFSEMAGRFEIRDIRMFATALSEGLPAGVNQVELVRSISAALRLKNDTNSEVERTVNLPKYNNRVVMAMPFAVILLVRKMSPEYLEILETGPGRAIMIAASICIILALAAGYFIGDIRV